MSVRWLSLERCVTRILRLYDPLASYFKSASMVHQLLQIWFQNCVYLWYSNLVLFFNSRWQSGEVQETYGDVLWAHDRGVPTVLPGYHTNIHLIQPPAPERAVVNIFIAWWGTLGGWDMLLLLCAFSVWCYLLWACTSVTHCFAPLNVCIADDKLHSQAVCKVHGAYSAAGPQTAPWNCF